MTIVTLDSASANYVWSNIRDRLSLLPNPDLALQVELDGSDEDRRRLDIEYVTCMTLAAFGDPIEESPYGPTTFDGWKSRIAFLGLGNPDIYRVVRLVADTFSLDLSQAEGGPSRPLDFGAVIGFTATLPLTPDGCERYLAGKKVLRELVSEDLVFAPYQRHSVLYPVIVGAVAIAEIHGSGAYRVGERMTTTGSLVLEALFRQIARFIPRISVSGKSASPKVRIQDGDRYPAVLCPLSGRFTGVRFAERAGFRLMPRVAGSSGTVGRTDKGGNEIWCFRPEEVNSLRPGELRERMLSTIKLLSRCTRRS